MYLLRGLDSNQRFPTYEDGEITHFSTPQHVKIEPILLNFFEPEVFLT